MESFAEKYRPTIDIINSLNPEQVSDIKNWVETFDDRKESSDGKKQKKKDNNHSCLVISGDHGIGKSVTVSLILEDQGYKIKPVNMKALESKKDIEEYINRTINSNNVFHQLEGIEYKYAIVIDNLEALTSTIEKKFVETLAKLNEDNWYLPIIFITDRKHNSTINTIKQNSNLVYLNSPNRQVMFHAIKRICKEESIIFDGKETCNKLLDHANGDYRILLTTLQDLARSAIEVVDNGVKRSRITGGVLEEYFKTTQEKVKDLDIYTITEGLMESYKSVNDCFTAYDGEKVIIPLMVHQNYAKCLMDNDIDTAARIAESIAQGDFIENKIYSTQNWDIQYTHGFFSCVYPSYLVNSTQKYRNGRFEFPSDLSKTSIRQINKKNITNVSTKFKNLEIEDFMYAIHLVTQLINDDEIEKCGDLLREYKLSIDNLETLMKIDKTSEKVKLPLNTKKRLALYLL